MKITGSQLSRNQDSRAIRLLRQVPQVLSTATAGRVGLPLCFQLPDLVLLENRDSADQD